jgi:hypothetical protein
MPHRKEHSAKLISLGHTRRIVVDSITGVRPKPTVGVEWDAQKQKLVIQYEPVESPNEIPQAPKESK